MIVLRDHSTRTKPPGVIETIAIGVAAQLRRHVCPEYRLIDVGVVLLPVDVPLPHGAIELALFDNADQQGALGYHTTNPDGSPYGRVFVNETLGHGGSWTGPGAMSVASVVSHEAIEIVVDPAANRWASDWGGALWAFEACDPVEGDAYPITVRGVGTIGVSNFVFPAWFDPGVTHTRLDHLGYLTTPFELRTTGYAIKEHEGQPVAVWGDIPEWKRTIKQTAGARTARRLATKIRSS